MIAFDGHILLYVYILLFASGLFFSLSHIYHAIRFGGRDPLSLSTTGVFIAGLVIIIFFSVGFLIQVNWTTPYSVNVPAVDVGLPSSGDLNI